MGAGFFAFRHEILRKSAVRQAKSFGMTHLQLFAQLSVKETDVERTAFPHSTYKKGPIEELPRVNATVTVHSANTLRT